MKSDLIAIGNTFVKLDIEKWEKHGRNRFEVRVLCVENPYSDYDGIRDINPKKSDVKEAIDWIIENENQTKMKGYTDNQIINLTEKINELINHRTNDRVFRTTLRQKKPQKP